MQLPDDQRRTTTRSARYQTIQMPAALRDKQPWQRSNKP
jgi:hypothetical protein